MDVRSVPAFCLSLGRLFVLYLIVGLLVGSSSFSVKAQEPETIFSINDFVQTGQFIEQVETFLGSHIDIDMLLESEYLASYLRELFGMYPEILAELETLFPYLERVFEQLVELFRLFTEEFEGVWEWEDLFLEEFEFIPSFDNMFEGTLFFLQDDIHFARIPNEPNIRVSTDRNAYVFGDPIYITVTLANIPSSYVRFWVEGLGVNTTSGTVEVSNGAGMGTVRIAVPRPEITKLDVFVEIDEEVHTRVIPLSFSTRASPIPTVLPITEATGSVKLPDTSDLGENRLLVGLVIFLAGIVCFIGVYSIIIRGRVKYSPAPLELRQGSVVEDEA